MRAIATSCEDGESFASVRYIMISKLFVVLTTVCVVAACSRSGDGRRDTVASSGDSSSTPSTSTLTVSEFGIGPIRAGMSVAEASEAVGGALAARPGTDTTACGYVEWRGGPAGVRVMIEHARIARVEVDSGATPTTEGIRVGDAEQQVAQRYGNRVAVTPSKYTKGHYLTVTPANPADSAFRIVFETENDRVVRYRAGRRPAVEYVERCG